MSTPRVNPAAGCRPLLVENLARVLPKGCRFRAYHLSSPPTKTDALCSAPPGEREDKTYCESHFLTVTIEAKQEDSTEPSPSNTTVQEDHSSDASGPEQVPILAIEVLIYTTAYCSTFFVSKADSTGYLTLLDLPEGTPSPIREVCGTFVSYLVEQRRRKDIRCVVSLFARAQDQYLFPGSIHNKTKHVLDDRGLVKWWCRVLDPLLEEPPAGRLGAWGATRGYLLVPGLDGYEMRAFLPRASSPPTGPAPGANSRWTLEHPLYKISHYAQEFDWVPARCLIPRYPDDPKSRFRDELDEEADRSKMFRATGHWRSVKSVEQFWEMMAYRQECSSGRLTGFIWVVFDPASASEPETSRKKEANGTETALSAPTKPPETETPSTPVKGRDPVSVIPPSSTPRKLFRRKDEQDAAAPPTPGAAKGKAERKRKKEEKRRLAGRIKPRQPHFKTRQRNHLVDRQKVSSAWYYWPPEGRGQKIVDESGYKRSIELLLHLDFANIGLATGSTRRWVREVGMGEDWGYQVVGEREPVVAGKDSHPEPRLGSGPERASGVVNNLSGLVKRKRPADAGDGGDEPPSKVNVLDTGLVRKKPKAGEQLQELDLEAQSRQDIHVLSAGLVRKKPKA